MNSLGLFHLVPHPVASIWYALWEVQEINRCLAQNVRGSRRRRGSVTPARSVIEDAPPELRLLLECGRLRLAPDAPERIGKALGTARLCHFFSLISLVGFGIIARMGMIYFCGLSIIAFLLFYEHLIVRGEKLNLSKVNIAFFNINAIVSFAVLLFSASDVLFLS